jgi:hypothetical protein
MSIPVDLTELADTLRDYTAGYLLTVSEEQRPHAVSVRPTFDGQALVVDGLGTRTRVNLEARPDVTVLWPPFEYGGYSLIVDGRATVSDVGVSVVPEHAVLHRPAEPGAEKSGTGCAADCVPL